jgi:hypothetical protein
MKTFGLTRPVLLAHPSLPAGWAFYLRIQPPSHHGRFSAAALSLAIALSSAKAFSRAYVASRRSTWPTAWATRSRSGKSGSSSISMESISSSAAGTSTSASPVSPRIRVGHRRRRARAATRPGVSPSRSAAALYVIHLDDGNNAEVSVIVRLQSTWLAFDASPNAPLVKFGREPF